ncbi:MAG: J domain-containing protein [Hyphomicrobium sp.]
MWGCGQADCGSAAAADQLAMPYVCGVEGGEPKLYPGPETHFKIIGRRDEQPFLACAKGAAARCETMMVHRFTIECDGARFSWARVAEAGRNAGAKIPDNLPSGFAPVSALAGRIVLPSLTRIDAAGMARVAMQDLSPDSVTISAAPPNRRREQTWTTSVSADAAPALDGGAARVAAWVAALMLAMLGASLAVAGRFRRQALAFEGMAETFGAAGIRVFDAVRTARRSIEVRLWSGSAPRSARDDCPRTHALFNASLLIHARLAEAELALAALSEGLLLREVLETEIEQVRQRTADADRRIRARSPDRSAAIFRGLHRDLDRISRIAQGAAATTQRDEHETCNAPQSQLEAYRVLGLNADAPPAAVKKLVEALRMTWHPDHARDEPDRKRREARMKQINAAWDMIRETRRAA